MIHIYYGDGKGKTTAACGLALRMAGHGKRVLFAQFFKDGSSGEIAAMSALENIVTRCPPIHYGRYKALTDAQRAQIRECYCTYLAGLIRDAENFELVVFDEILSACSYGCIDRHELTDFLRTQGPRREIVLTGRGPSPELLELADYATEMRKEKHPFDNGTTAREGVEY